MKFTFVEALLVVFVVAIVAAALLLPFYSCRAKAGAMKMNYTWGLDQGCMIETKPWQWVPLANYRVL
jgi:hypothetical protein